MDSPRNEKAALLSPAVLAYVGDAVFELYIRESLVKSGMCGTARSLHRRATQLVCAPAQADMARSLLGSLTEEEENVLRRGRNAHCGHTPSGVDVTDYRLATGLECLFGYLYLSGRMDRFHELMEIVLDTSPRQGGSS